MVNSFMSGAANESLASKVHVEFLFIVVSMLLTWTALYQFFSWRAWGRNGRKALNYKFAFGRS